MRDFRGPATTFTTKPPSRIERGARLRLQVAIASIGAKDLPLLNEVIRGWREPCGSAFT